MDYEQNTLDTMSYEPPVLELAKELYETPLLIDVEEAASCNSGCFTGGS